MVAHDIADASFLLPVMMRRRTFFQENSSRALPIDEFEVEPCLVVAALIGRAQAWSFLWDGESDVKSDFPVLVGLRRLQEPAHINPAAWNRTWAPQRKRHRQSAFFYTQPSSACNHILSTTWNRASTPLPEMERPFPSNTKHHTVTARQEMLQKPARTQCLTSWSTSLPEREQLEQHEGTSHTLAQRPLRRPSVRLSQWQPRPNDIAQS